MNDVMLIGGVSVLLQLGLCLRVADAGEAGGADLSGATVETVADGFAFTEGPALAPDGSIYFTDIPRNAIHRYDPATGQTTRFTGASGGANGLMFSPDGDGLYACAGKARTLHHYRPQPPAEGATDTFELIQAPQPLTMTFEGKRFNSPNDLALGDRGIYFTDPRYGNRDDMQMQIEGVYVLTAEPDTHRPLVVRLIDDLVRPNGLAITADGKTLYIADHGDAKLWAYPILETTRLGEPRLLHDMADLGGGDGMTIDQHGRLFVTVPQSGGVLMLTPDGERLGFIETGPQTSNCTFGADGKTLYVTAEKSLKRVTWDR